jgi:hypothetical protein
MSPRSSTKIMGHLVGVNINFSKTNPMVFHNTSFWIQKDVLCHMTSCSSANLKWSFSSFTNFNLEWAKLCDVVNALMGIVDIFTICVGFIGDGCPIVEGTDNVGVFHMFKHSPSPSSSNVTHCDIGDLSSI